MLYFIKELVTDIFVDVAFIKTGVSEAHHPSDCRFQKLKSDRERRTKERARRDVHFPSAGVVGVEERAQKIVIGKIVNYGYGAEESPPNNWMEADTRQFPKSEVLK